MFYGWRSLSYAITEKLMLSSIVRAIIRLGIKFTTDRSTQVGSYFACFCAFLVVVWLGISNYYYLIGKIENSIGALITGGLSLLLWLIIILFNFYKKRKKMKASLLDSWSKDLLILGSPILIKKLLSNVNKKKALLILSVGIVILVLLRKNLKATSSNLLEVIK